MAEDAEKLLRRIEKGWNKIRDLLLGMGEPDFMSDPKVQDEVIAELIEVGKAVKDLPGEVRMQDTSLEWDEIAAWPEALAAGRERVELKKVWGWATNEMYELRELVTGMEPEEG